MAGEMVRMRFLTSISFALGRSYAPGEEGPVEAAEAKRLVAAGYAEYVERPREKATKKPKRETRGGKGEGSAE